MPEMSGQEVAKAIKNWEFENRHQIEESVAKILMISGMDDGRTIMSSFRQGCEGYVVKPITPEKLAQKLAEIDIVKPG